MTATFRPCSSLFTAALVALLAGCGGGDHVDQTASPSTSDERAHALAVGAEAAPGIPNYYVKVVSPPPGASRVGFAFPDIVLSMNASGQVTGTAFGGVTQTAFFYDGLVTHAVASPAGFPTSGSTLSDAGEIFGSYQTAQGSVAFKWTLQGGFLDIFSVRPDLVSSNARSNFGSSGMGFGGLTLNSVDPAIPSTPVSPANAAGFLMTQTGAIIEYPKSATHSQYAQFQALNNNKHALLTGCLGGEFCIEQGFIIQKPDGTRESAWNGPGALNAGGAQPLRSSHLGDNNAVFGTGFNAQGVVVLRTSSTAFHVIGPDFIRGIGSAGRDAAGHSNTAGWVWNEGTDGQGITTEVTLNGIATNMFSVNNKGIAVGHTIGNLGPRAVVWSKATGAIELSTKLVSRSGAPLPAGVEITSAVSINDAGHILALSNEGMVVLVPVPLKEYLVHVSQSSRNYDVVKIALDGSERVRLTSGLDASAPTWSPDHSQIAFYSNGPKDFDIWVMNADGTGQRRLTANAGRNFYPAWSPDGSRIAFSSVREGRSIELYLMNKDGSQQTRITNSGVAGQQPTWSPDAKKIAFYRSAAGGGAIYVMNSDGTGQVRITNPADNLYDPKWSPDGSKISVTANRRGLAYVDSMSPDGTGRVQLVEGAQGAWSPDGLKLVYSSRVNGDYEIYLSNADGTNPQRLTSQRGFDGQPSW